MVVLSVLIGVHLRPFCFLPYPTAALITMRSGDASLSRKAWILTNGKAGALCDHEVDDFSGAQYV